MRFTEYTAAWTSKESEFDSRQGQEVSLFSNMSRHAVRQTQLLIKLVPRFIFLTVKQPEHEVVTLLHSVPRLKDVRPVRFHDVLN
jgi:hypothetical protein